MLDSTVPAHGVLLDAAGELGLVLGLGLRLGSRVRGIGLGLGLELGG